MLDNISDNLILELRKFQEVRKAVEAEEKTLNEVYQIKREADSLAALILTQQKKEQDFDQEFKSKCQELEQEMEETHQQWDKEQSEYLQNRKEEEEQLKRERKREEEDYQYNLALARKKDQDTYEAQELILEKELKERKESFEKEIQLRWTELTKREEELNQLKSKVEQFPMELEKTKKAVEKEIADRLEFQYKYKIELTGKEIEGERRLLNQKIETLESKIKEQNELIDQLTRKTDEAGIKVENIALKAIEGASFQRSTQFGRTASGSEQQNDPKTQIAK
jgi:hypothetical protein